jgi:hypothetical protein
MEDYEPDVWGYNGPDKITKIFHDYCSLLSPDVIEVRCDFLDLFVFQRNRAFAVIYSRIKHLFNPNLLKNSWNESNMLTTFISTRMSVRTSL